MFRNKEIARKLGMKAKPLAFSRQGSLSSLHFGAITPVGDEPVNTFTFRAKVSTEDLADFPSACVPGSPSETFEKLILPLAEDPEKRKALNAAARAVGVLYIANCMNNSGFVCGNRRIFVTCHHKGQEFSIRPGGQCAVSFSSIPEDNQPAFSSSTVPAQYLGDLYHTDDKLDVEVWHLMNEPPAYVIPLEIALNPLTKGCAIYGSFVNHIPREIDINDFYQTKWEGVADEADFHQKPPNESIALALRPLNKVVALGLAVCGISSTDQDLIKKSEYEFGTPREGDFVGVQLSCWFGSPGGPVLVFEDGALRVVGMVSGATIRNKNRALVLGVKTRALITRFSTNDAINPKGHTWQEGVCQ